MIYDDGQAPSGEAEAEEKGRPEMQEGPEEHQSPTLPLTNRGAVKTAAVAGICLLTLAACGGARRGTDWPLPNLDLSSTRALAGSGIDRSNVRALRLRPLPIGTPCLA